MHSIKLYPVKCQIFVKENQKLLIKATKKVTNLKKNLHILLKQEIC